VTICSERCKKACSRLFLHCGTAKQLLHIVKGAGQHKRDQSIDFVSQILCFLYFLIGFILTHLISPIISCCHSCRS